MHVRNVFGLPVAHGNLTTFVVSGVVTVSAVKLQAQRGNGRPGCGKCDSSVRLHSDEVELETPVLRITAPIPSILKRQWVNNAVLLDYAPH